MKNTTYKIIRASPLSTLVWATQYELGLEIVRHTVPTVNNIRNAIEFERNQYLKGRQIYYQ